MHIGVQLRALRHAANDIIGRSIDASSNSHYDISLRDRHQLPTYKSVAVEYLVLFLLREPKAATMSFTIYIIAINGGHVVEADNAGKEIKTQKATVSKSQQWVVEWKGAGKSDEFALRNVATDAYLGAPKGVSGTYCTTNAKQFWRAEPGHAPGSFW